MFGCKSMIAGFNMEINVSFVKDYIWVVMIVRIVNQKIIPLGILYG